MKRKLALFMVMAMLVSLVPMNVFAASKNTALSVPSVDKDTIFTGADCPIVRVEENSTAEWTVGGAKTFEVELTNAEWSSVYNVGDVIPTTETNPAGAAGFVTTLTKRTDNIASGEIAVTAATTGSNKAYFDIAMITKATGGEAKAHIIARDSNMTDSTVTFANAVSGATKTTVASVKTFADSTVLDSLKIDELVINTVPTSTRSIQMKLPAGFEWQTSTNTVSFAGGWTSAGTRVAQIDSNDARIMKVTVKLTNSGTQRGIMYLTDFKIKRTSDANVGDVELNIKEVDASTNGNSGEKFTEESLVVAKYSSYDLTFKTLEDPTTIYSGRYEGATDTAQKTAKVQIKEEVVNSWLANRTTKIQFNDEVKVLGYDIKLKENIQNGSIKVDAASGGTAAVATGSKVTSGTNRNYIEITAADITSGSKAKVEIVFYVSVKANYTGDVKATISGTAISKEQTIVVAKAVAPAAIAVVSKDVKIGLKNQPAGDIVITEPAKAVWQGNSDGSTKYLTVSFDDGIVPNEKGTVKVTKGNVTLGTYRISGNTLQIPIKYESTVPSEITITGVTVDVNRSVPEGTFEAQIGGTSIVNNNATDESACRFNKSNAQSVAALRVITPAPGDTKTIQKVVFTIGAKEYKVGDTAVTSDVAPFINEQGRTMLPLRAFANALNVANDNIVWNEAERSVIIFKGDATVKVVIGQAQFSKNGVVIPMDTQAIIQDGRTLLPLRAVAQALGANITWDEATKTVTVQ